MPADHRHGDARDAHQLVALVGDLHLPNLRAAPDVIGLGHAIDPTVLGAADMVGVDLLAHASVLVAVDAADGGGTARVSASTTEAPPCRSPAGWRVR